MRINSRINLFRAVRRESMDESVTLNVYSPGVRIGGRWSEIAPTTAACTASIQVVTGEVKQAIAEQFRSSETIEVFAVSELQPLSRSDGTRPSEVVWRGKRYSIEVLEDWSENGLYWSALCSLVEQ